MKSKRYTKITKERLDECLEIIGWSTRHYGCDCYYIMNQFGEPTDFMVWSKNPKAILERIELDAKFGKGQKNSNGGSCVFVLKGCYIKVDDKCVSIIANKAEKCNQPAFISFYNHTTK